MNNTTQLKGFRQAPQPTKGQVQKENQTLAQELNQKLLQMQQFYGNLINQVMRSSSNNERELSLVSIWLGSNPTSDASQKGDNLLLDYAGALLQEDGSLARITLQTAEGPKEIVDYFDGGSGKLFMLTNLGGGTLIPGFEEQLVGLKAGEGKEIDVQFPAEYAVKSLQGQKARFTVFVHEVRRSFPVSPVGALVDANQQLRKDARDAETLAKAQAAAEASNPNKGPGADSVPAAQESQLAEAPASEVAPEQAPSS